MNEIAEFDDLLNVGALSKDIKIGSHVITLKTLTYDVYSKLIGGASNGENPVESQIFVLASSIAKINGKDVSLEAKIKLLKGAQVGLIGLITAEYEKMIEEQSKAYEEVKKNTSTTSTKTA